MAHAEHGKTAKYIDQGPAEISGQIAVSHAAAVPVEADSGQIHPDRDHGVVKDQHVLLRYQDRGQAERISDHIVLQRCEKIRAIAYVQVKGRKLRMPGQNAFQDSPPPSGVIAECRKVLGESVPFPDHSLAGHGKVPENQYPGQNKQYCISQQKNFILLDQSVFFHKTLVAARSCCSRFFV